MNVIRPPTRIRNKVVFLAGSIEQGAAEPWQKKIEEALTDFDVTLLNPRREDWDPNMKDITPQVEWELNGLKEADLIVMYFDPNTKSPITLLELGLFAASGKLLVCCPEGYWRKQNVDIVCQKWGVGRAKTLEALIEILRLCCHEISNYGLVRSVY